ncbi:MAG: CocE/NonD family hydrolase [Armatimonadetes bacterium]|nr:CocE/NonD family hydrolase [Armatimonadota bacterium]
MIEKRWQRVIIASLACFGCIGFLICIVLSHQKPAVKKQTVMVPMRDGVRLATDIYLPEGDGSFPVILLRSPYDRKIGEGIAHDAVHSGYVMVIQNTRGRFGSEGENLPFEADGWWGPFDGEDTVEWLMKQPWCNGKIGTWGGSALGITQYLLAGTGTKKIVTQHITVGAPSLYNVIYWGGVFRKAMIEDWLRITQFSPEALKIWKSHHTYDDYWRKRDMTNRYRMVNCPAIHIGGWYDIFAQATLDAFVGYQTEGGKGARGKQKLLMGPWAHGVFQEKVGELIFPDAKNPPTSAHSLWKWFDHYLKGVDNGIDREPAVTYYVMGDVTDPDALGNEWRTANQWPPVKSVPTPFYFHPDKSLSLHKPKKSVALTYTYDPKDPVPTVGGPNLTLPAGPMDQRKIEGRPDVLVFSTEPLKEPLEVTGRVKVILWASSDAPDTDFVAKLCDVYPDGRSFNVCEGIVRARFREGFSKEQMMQPGKIYRFEIDLWSTSIVFNKGHRIRVIITSSNFPAFEPNPNTGEPFYSEDRTRVAQNTIHMSPNYPSHILLPIVGNK